jgi:acetylornithine/succinyldiaminopimelate/putrescine aminotransferase
VLADDEVMLTIGRGQHGSTYGGNPIAAAVGKAALEVRPTPGFGGSAGARAPRMLPPFNGPPGRALLSHGAFIAPVPIILSTLSALQSHSFPQVLVDEKLSDNAEALGRIFRARLSAIPSPRIKAVRGRGLLNALVIEERGGVSAWDVCIKLRDAGLLSKPTHGDTIRLAPPLVLTEGQLLEAADIIEKTVLALDA